MSDLNKIIGSILFYSIFRTFFPQVLLAFFDSIVNMILIAKT